jgi:hypothetical protein
VEELGRRDLATARGRLDHHGRVEGDQQGGQVVGRVAQAAVAADRAPVADLLVLDVAGHVGQQRVARADLI